MPPHVKPPCKLGFIQKVEPIQEESEQLSNINMDESTKKLVQYGDKKDFSFENSKPNLKSEKAVSDNETILQSSIDKEYAQKSNYSYSKLNEPAPSSKHQPSERNIFGEKPD